MNDPWVEIFPNGMYERGMAKGFLLKALQITIRSIASITKSSKASQVAQEYFSAFSNLLSERFEDYRFSLPPTNSMKETRSG